MNPLIELRGVGYQQGQTPILTGVDWRLMPGEHWAVLGPNGCGKTTLLRVACGYEWPTSGKVLRGGQELADLTALRSRMGWVGVEMLARVPPDQSALQIAASGAIGQIGLRLIGQVDPTSSHYEQAEQVLRDIGCGAIVDSPWRVLSQGERQKVLVARARMTDPWLLVLDEPCAGMDPGARERFLAWLESQLRDERSPSLLMVTHHVEEIMPGVEQTLVMDQGQIAAAGPTAEVVTEELLSRLYGVRVEQIVHSRGRLWPVCSAAGC
ncbi:putative ABC transporter ATP-binding protein YlmA [Posidoniimonas polymericola]|uniref:Putative ABC transporter ATP-binding protein YlmA n=1 Tax=Posidoniimonas polymericola TaxID=2528002 RepID=A0A5C5YPQ0_9BACT|nr:ATP-binding cassette domain-containing protein [Posidoniimonas polymericola]TWT76931.1 putative ABC transporter ATP-binding protein YlmA [Posidoniimonas polymericola]